MITIKEYVKPNSVAEAYSLLTTGENPAVIGGGFFLRLASRKIGTAIDLSKAGLDYIRETDNTIEIGVMASFRQLEQEPILQQNLDGLIPATLANLPGVQIKNMVSVGGTVWGRYGFSELITCLMVLDCRVQLYKNGILALPDFLAAGSIKDVLEKVILAKEPLRASYKAFRNSSGSLPILCTAVSKNTAGYKIAVGGRAGVAALATKAMEYLNNQPLTPEAAEKAADLAATELEFTNDRRASAEYRRQLCRVLVKRTLMEVQP